MADDGVKFGGVYAQTPYTPVSVSTLLTGRYALLDWSEESQKYWKQNYHLFAFYRKPPKLKDVTPLLTSKAIKERDKIETLPELLRERGYNNYLVHSNSLLDLYCRSGGYGFKKENVFRINRGSEVRAITKLCKRISDKEPFFAYFHLGFPHGNWNLPFKFQNFFGVCNRRNYGNYNAENPTNKGIEEVNCCYDNALRYADSIVGKIVNSLSSDSLIIVTADHGEALLEHGTVSHNVLFDCVTHIPLVMNKMVKGNNGFHELIDLTPTILDYLSIPKPEMSGVNLFKSQRKGVFSFWFPRIGPVFTYKTKQFRYFYTPQKKLKFESEKVIHRLYNKQENLITTNPENKLIQYYYSIVKDILEENVIKP